jgi:hypothetical protein
MQGHGGVRAGVGREVNERIRAGGGEGADGVERQRDGK